MPLYGAFFLFILFSNLLGLIPGFSPPTGNVNTTLGLGLLSFVMFNYFGFQAHGIVVPEALHGTGAVAGAADAAARADQRDRCGR